MQENSCCFWSQGSGGVAEAQPENVIDVFGEFTVKQKRVKSRGDITERRLEVTKVGEKGGEQRTVTLLQLSGWSQGEVPHPPVMLSLVDMLSKAQRKTPSSRHTIIMCRSLGIIITLHTFYIVCSIYTDAVCVLQ